jgi:hypothetical protein
MKKILILAAILTLAGCSKPAETSTSVGREFVVDKLFTHEGCTVYRFNDGGNNRYFTNCQGSTSWTESCGKNCTRQMNIN